MAILLALGAAISYGVGDYVGGRHSRHNAPVVIALLAELTVLPVLLVVVPLVEGDAPTAAAWWWGMAAGAAGSLGVLGLYAALSRGNMTVVAPVTGVVAAVVPVAVGIALGERPSVASAGGIVLAIVAVGLIGGVLGVTHVAVHGPTVVLAVFVGVAFGLLFVAYSRAGDDAGLWPLLAARFGGAPLLALAYLVARHRRMVAPPHRSAVLPGMAVGAMVGIANLLYLLASRRGLLSIVAVVVSLYPASTIALAAVLDRERISRSQSVGMALAVVAVGTITSGS